MPTKARTLTKSGEESLRTVMDRLVPAVDDLPSAGSMGLMPEAVSIAARVPRLGESLVRVIGAISLDMHVHTRGGINALSPELQDEAIRTVEGVMPDDFANVLELVYLAYYADSRVHKRIGWHGRPPQPEGYELAPFDESLLETVRKRQPFWRKDS